MVMVDSLAEARATGRYACCLVLLLHFTNLFLATNLQDWGIVPGVLPLEMGLSKRVVLQ